MPAASASLLQALEAVAVVLTLLSVWWARQRDRRTWPVGGAAALAYGGWFVAHGWWGNGAFQLLVLAQALWGWIRWGADIPPLSRRQLIGLSSGLALLAVVVLSTVAATPIHQAEWALSLASVAATIGLIQQRPGSWAAWAIIDVGYVALFLATAAWLSAGLYAALTLFALHTWLEWRRPVPAAGQPTGSTIEDRPEAPTLLRTR